MAASPARQRHSDRPRESDQPNRAGLDELLGPFLPVPDVCPPETHQRLPDAVGSQEVQTAAFVQTPPGVVGSGGASRTWSFRALAVDERRRSFGRMVGAV